MRKLTAKDVTFTVTLEPEDLEVRGHFMSGDPEYEEQDRALEDRIIEAANRGDVEAWCCITVKATYTIGDDTFEGSDHLGACSFLEPFEHEGEVHSIQRQIDDTVDGHGMREQALDDLNAEIKRQRAAARKLLRQTA